MGLQTPGEIVDANFGQQPFVFDIEEIRKVCCTESKMLMVRSLLLFLWKEFNDVKDLASNSWTLLRNQAVHINTCIEIPIKSIQVLNNLFVNRNVHSVVSKETHDVCFKLIMQEISNLNFFFNTGSYFFMYLPQEDPVL